MVHALVYGCQAWHVDHKSWNYNGSADLIAKYSSSLQLVADFQVDICCRQAAAPNKLKFLNSKVYYSLIIESISFSNCA